MNRASPRQSLSIFRRTLLLLVGSLLLVQLISIALIITLPPPRPFFVGMVELADVLTGAGPASGRHRRMDPEAFTVGVATSIPGPEVDMVEQPELTQELAERLKRPATDVRLYFHPDRGSWVPYRPRDRGAVMRRHGDAIFTDAVLAAMRTEQGWRTVRTPDRPLVSDWQWRWILWFGLSLLLMLSLAWVFARRLSQPIRNFASAADRIGHEPNAPAVPVEGPEELRVAARALNGMQARIDEYVRERTAMVAAIAHDLRTPLARIAFRIEAAPDSIRQPVHDDIRAMTEMISTTLDYAKGVAPLAERQRVDVAGLLQRIGEAARQTGRAVSVELEDPPEVVADPLALRRLFENLVDNAIKFGGEARVHARGEPGATVVEVRDRGPGLPEAMLEEVFAPFVRNDPSRNRTTGGVGLGLTIARSIALEHGGSLALANAVDGGLIATLRLPAV